MRRASPETGAAAELLSRGFVLLSGPWKTREAAWSSADEIIEEAIGRDRVGSDMGGLEVVGEFNVPPPGALRRGFQPLHLDFGLPIASAGLVDVARFTALYIDRDRPPTGARTRVAPLAPLLAQRSWAGIDTLIERFREYGRASDAGGAPGYTEGILGRLIEAADGSRTLPSPAGLLCGLEFESLEGERRHFAERGLYLDRVEVRVRLEPGGLLLLDNLLTAHGREGLRQPRELHQRCIGYRGLRPRRQARLVRRVLEAVIATRNAERM